MKIMQQMSLLQIWGLILVWPMTRMCFGHLQHAVALLLYGAVTADVKLAELLLWAENHIESFYWLVGKETLLSVWRWTSPRPRGQTLQTLSGVSDETGGPSVNKTQQTASVDRSVNEWERVTRKVKLTVPRDPFKVAQKGFEFLQFLRGRTFK